MLSRFKLRGGHSQLAVTVTNECYMNRVKYWFENAAGDVVSPADVDMVVMVSLDDLNFQGDKTSTTATGDFVLEGLTNIIHISLTTTSTDYLLMEIDGIKGV